MTTSTERALNPNSREAQEQERRDVKGRPVIPAVQQKEKEEKDKKEKPADPD